MGDIFKLSTLSQKTSQQTKYNSMLAGNAFFDPENFRSIATATVGSGGSTSISFSSIPTTYTNLQIRALIKTSDGSGASIQFNSDTNTNYLRHRAIYNGTSALAAFGNTLTAIPFNGNAGYAEFGPLIVDIIDYKNTNKYTTTRSLAGMDNNGSGGVEIASGLWLNSNAVTDITILPLTGGTNKFLQYSHFALYGMKG